MSLIQCPAMGGKDEKGRVMGACARHTAQQQQLVLAAVHEALGWVWDDLQTVAADTQAHKCTMGLFASLFSLHFSFSFLIDLVSC